MSETYNLLQKHGFHQVHQGYIVNFEKVKCFTPTSLLLDNDSVVMISVRKRRETMLAYSRFLEHSS
jgi:DNA-binding LytR/AlgR family response regulator